MRSIDWFASANRDFAAAAALAGPAVSLPASAALFLDNRRRSSPKVHAGFLSHLVDLPDSLPDIGDLQRCLQCCASPSRKIDHDATAAPVLRLFWSSVLKTSIANDTRAVALRAQEDPGFDMDDRPPVSARFAERQPGEYYDFGEGPVAAHTHPRGGGWVADTADMDPNAFVEKGSVVSGRARVRGPVLIQGASIVRDYAWVWGNVTIDNGSLVCEHGMVSEWAWVNAGSIVRGSAWVTGNAYLGGVSVATDEALVAQDARVEERSEVSGRAQVYGAAQLRNGARLSGDEKLFGNVRKWGMKREP